jgi:hypothetical protein
MSPFGTSRPSLHGKKMVAIGGTADSATRHVYEPALGLTTKELDSRLRGNERRLWPSSRDTAKRRTRNPDQYNKRSVKPLDSGFAPSARPGMTAMPIPHF